MQKVEYVRGSELPVLSITWYDADKNLIDFSTDHSFTLKIGNIGEVALLTKTSGIQGAAMAPNVVVTWSTTGELNTLPGGTYHAQLTAQRIADGKERTMRFTFEIEEGIL